MSKPVTDRPKPMPQPENALARLRAAAAASEPARTAAKQQALLASDAADAQPPVDSGPSGTNRRLIFGVDATASREAAWDTARDVTDALLQALPGRLDVALAVHGGGRVHTFSEFASDAYTLRERAAGVVCEAGPTRLLPILKSGLSRSNVALVIYIGDAFEEDVGLGNQLCDLMGQRGIRLVVLHDTAADEHAKNFGEVFAGFARRTGGCVLPFDASALDRLRDLLAALATLAVGGVRLLVQRQHELPGAADLLEHLPH